VGHAPNFQHLLLTPHIIRLDWLNSRTCECKTELRKCSLEFDFMRNDHAPNCAETIAIGSEKV